MKNNSTDLSVHSSGCRFIWSRRSVATAAFTILGLFLAAPDFVQAGPPPGTGQWTQTFNEDFNGTSLNTAIWNYGFIFAGPANNEPQAYRPENVTVANGICTIKVEKKFGLINKSGGCPSGTTVLNVDGFNFPIPNGSIISIGGNANRYTVVSTVGGNTPTQITVSSGLTAAVADNTQVVLTAKIQNMYGYETGTFDYRSGLIQSYKKFAQAYGYFEARIKMAPGKGCWGGLWMNPDRGPSVTNDSDRAGVGTRGGLYAMGNEIDVAEYLSVWQDPITNLSLSHSGYFWGYDPAVDDSFGRYTAIDELFDPNHQFHTYGVYWAPGLLIYYIDGVAVLKKEDPIGIAACPEYLILNVALSQNSWFMPTLTLAEIDAGLPCNMEIDYVRAWSGTAPGENSGDIGAVGLAGSDSVNSATGVYTLNAGGAGITGSADAFHYRSRMVTGDCTIVARVDSLTNTINLAQAGVMMRQQVDDVGSPNAFMLIPANAPASFQYRSTTGASTSAVNMTGATVTMADGFTDGTRTNGTDANDTAWYTLGTSAVAVVDDSAGLGSGGALELTPTSTGRGLVAGMPLRTLADGESLTLTFNWRFTGTTGLNQINSFRFGLHSSNGTATTADNTTASDNDMGYFVMTNPGATGSNTTLKRETGGSPGVLGGTDWSGLGTAGLSVSAGTSNHSAMLKIARVGATLVVTSSIDNLAAASGTDSSPVSYTFDELGLTLAGATIPSPLRIDNVQVSYSSGASGSTTPPGWVKLNRTGNVFTGYYSTDGTTWIQVGSQSITMPSSIYVGLAASSHANAVLTTGTFSNVTTTPDFRGEDIGDVGVTGSESVNNGTYTIQAAGMGAGGTEDGCRFLSQTLVGDGSITARVNSIVSANYSARAGVMIRPVPLTRHTHEESRMATVTVPKGGNFYFATRLNDYGPSTNSGGINLHPVYWVRLTRVGDTFTGYRSSDGVTWIQAGTPQTVVMSKSVQVGLVASNGSTTALGTATIDNVTITGMRGF